MGAGNPSKHDRDRLVLGIETSCDETAAAVVGRDAAGRGRILSNVVRSQWENHRTYGGVVPEIAARAHVECLDTLIGEAMAGAGVGWDDLDGVAATAGPGLVGGLIVGLTTAKAIALARGIPLLAINHLEAHALTVGLTAQQRKTLEGLLATLAEQQGLTPAVHPGYRQLGRRKNGATGTAPE